MWFNRKPRNRRFEREHVLDVKLSSRQIRAARVRMASVALGVSFGTLFLLFLLWRAGNWALSRLVYENPTFALQVLDIRTDGSMACEQIRRWAGLQPGDNLLALDLARVKRDLELVPMIESVSVERVLPRTLRIRVLEREPIAQILQPFSAGRAPALYTLDDAGYVMLPLQPFQRAVATPTNEPLPVITGLSLMEIRPGRPVETPQFKAALRLIAAFERSPMAGLVDLRWIDVSAPEVLQVTTSQGSKVTFATASPESQLRRWRAAYDYGRSQGKALASLDLSVANNIPATWIAASALPPLAPKAVKPPRNNRKKHV